MKIEIADYTKGTVIFILTVEIFLETTKLFVLNVFIKIQLIKVKTIKKYFFFLILYFVDIHFIFNFKKIMISTRTIVLMYFLNVIVLLILVFILSFIFN